MAGNYNTKNKAVKRILQEIKEVQEDTSGDFLAEALEVRKLFSLDLCRPPSCSLCSLLRSPTLSISLHAD